MKFTPYLRFILVINIIYNYYNNEIFNIDVEGIAVLTILEFSFILYQTLEGINEIQGMSLRANFLRLAAIIINTLTILLAGIFLTLTESWFMHGFLFYGMILLSSYILIVDTRTYFRMITQANNG